MEKRIAFIGFLMFLAIIECFIGIARYVWVSMKESSRKRRGMRFSKYEYKNATKHFKRMGIMVGISALLSVATIL